MYLRIIVKFSGCSLKFKSHFLNVFQMCIFNFDEFSSLLRKHENSAQYITKHENSTPCVTKPFIKYSPNHSYMELKIQSILMPYAKPPHLRSKIANFENHIGCTSLYTRSGVRLSTPDHSECLCPLHWLVNKTKTSTYKIYHTIDWNA